MNGQPVASTSQQAPLFTPLAFKYQEAARKRGVQACVDCRRRKSKCDRVFPCSSCKAHGTEATCTEYKRDKQEAPIGYVPLADFVTLANRVKEHESALQQVHHTLQSLVGQGLLVNGQANDHSVAMFDSSYPFLHGEGPAQSSQDIPIVTDHMQHYTLPPNPPTGPSSQSSDDHVAPMEAMDDAARVLEDMAYARTSHARNQGVEDSTTFLGANVQIPRNPTHPFDARLSSLTDFESLPMPATARSLVKTAVDREWINMHCFHVPDFLQRCEDVWTWTPDTTLSYEDWQFLGLFFAVLATGATILSEADLETIHVRNRDKLVEVWAAQSMQCLYKGDWTQHHCLASLQAIILLFPFLLSLSRSESAITYISSALSIAGRLGLHRLVPEMPNLSVRETEKRYGKRWVLVKRREEGRRVMWNLMDMDSQFTADRSYVCAFFPSQNLSCLPHNIDDQDMVGHQLPAVSDQRTQCSLNVLRFQMLVPMQTLVMEHQGNPAAGYDSVKRAHASLCSIWDNRPAFYQSDEQLAASATPSRSYEQLVYERRVVTGIYHFRLLRIHRNWFPQSLTDSRYSLTLSTCVDSAISLINTLPGRVPASSARNTGLGTGLFSCSMVLLIRLKSLNGSEFAYIADQLQRGINLLSQIDLGSISKASGFLQQLLNRFVEAEASSSGQSVALSKEKRKRTQTDYEEPDGPAAQHLAVSNWKELFTDPSAFPPNSPATSADGFGLLNNFPCPTTADLSGYNDLFGQYLSFN